MPSPQLKFEWITSWDEVWSSAFLAQWHKLMEQDANAHVFFTPSAVRAWVETQLVFHSIQPRLLIARQAGELVLLFPLILERANWQGGWVRSLQPVGWNSFDYQNPILAASLAGQNNHLFADILETCRGSFGRDYDVLRFPFLRGDAFPKASAFPQADEAPFLDLKGVESLDQITANLSKGWRQDIRRQRRRLEQAGTVELVICEPNEVKKAQALFPHLMVFHSERWGYQRNEPAKRRIMTLWNNLATHALPAKAFHVSALRCGDEVIACSLSFQFNHRFYFYIPASSSKWSNYSPGKVHLSMLIEQAIANRVEVFDFLRGNESYKHHWTDKAMPLYGVEERIKGVGPLLRTNLQQSLNHLRAAAKSVVVHTRSILKPSKPVASQNSCDKQP